MMINSAAIMLLLVGSAMAYPIKGDEQTRLRVPRGVGYGSSNGNIIYDSKALAAISGGANAFVQGQLVDQAFQAATGQSSYLAQQSGLQALGAAAAGSAWAIQQYNTIASSAGGYH